MGPFKKVITTTMMTISWMTVCLKGLNDRCPHSSKSAEFIQINWKLHFPRIWEGKITHPFSNLVPHCFYHIEQFGRKTIYSIVDQQDMEPKIKPNLDRITQFKTKFKFYFLCAQSQRDLTTDFSNYCLGAIPKIFFGRVS